MKISNSEIRNWIEKQAEVTFGAKFDQLNKNQKFKAISYVVNNLLTEKRLKFKQRAKEQKGKKLYYMSMEFLLGRSLRNHLYNLGLLDSFTEVLKQMNTNIDDLYDVEPDAGLGNGGLGRLAAAFMESLTDLDYSASGFCIKYEYGIFKQKIEDGWQIELPDEWLSNGSVWLNKRDEQYKIKFGGYIEERWEEGKLIIDHKNADEIIAVPYDMNISGYNSHAVNRIRLWDPKPSLDFNLALFSSGQYVKAQENRAIAESIAKVLYPADDHIEGKSLRLKQQYFFVSASIQSILAHHMKDYGTLDNLGKKVSIHINDTHPTLCIPELMRILLDIYGYDWDKAWHIINETISYTNHTVMAEALEKWPEDLYRRLLPRIYQITQEINRRLCLDLHKSYPGNDWTVTKNAIIGDGQIRMANMCLASSHTINGVSALHSEILKDTIFNDFYRMQPNKFTNVTNGITYRRWIAQANPELDKLIQSLIGDSYLKDARELKRLEVYKNDKKVLQKLKEIKYNNKVKLAKYIKDTMNIDIDPNSIFDVQIKRLHEYKRQLLNALHILYLYNKLKTDKNFDIKPRTFIFAAKAAASYYMAKQIIKLICKIGEMVNNDPEVNKKLKVIFLENYRVSLSEIIIPAADISEQISVAGKEASGTGNMKFMANGAVTIGTLDGANVEIAELVGNENIVIFGLKTQEVERLYRTGYYPLNYYNSNPDIKTVVDMLRQGIAGTQFNEIADSLTIGGTFGSADPYMVLADFESYKNAQSKIDSIYQNEEEFFAMSLMNIAESGFFSSDRSIEEYVDKVWSLDKIKF